MDAQFLIDLQFWIGTDPRKASRVLRLVDEVLRRPFEGIGKPEPLRGRSRFWSRRIDEEHRLTYCVYDSHVDFVQARFHYSRLH